MVTVRPSVTITGPPGAIVKGAGAARIFHVRHSNVTLQGFTIDGRVGPGASARDYRDKLVYVMSTTPGVGVKRFAVRNMTLKNAGGECVRLRYLAEDAEVAGNRIGPCGIYDFKFNGGGKDGEGVYIGTSPEQLGQHGAPDTTPDVSKKNRIYDNVINTQGSECVEIKEHSTANIVERNQCTGEKDTESAGLGSRGDANVFRGNTVYGNTGAGIRFGGDTPNDGVHNDAYANTIRDNEGGGIKFHRIPQGKICGNIMSGNVGGNSVATYGGHFDPTRPC